MYFIFNFKNVDYPKLKSADMKVNSFPVILILITIISFKAVLSQEVIIDGISGEIIKKPESQYYPGQRVNIKIVKANLLKFNYEVKVDKEVFLVANYNIIGNESAPKPLVYESTPFPVIDFSSFTTKIELVQESSPSNEGNIKEIIDELQKTYDKYILNLTELSSQLTKYNEIETNKDYFYTIVNKKKNEYNWNTYLVYEIKNIKEELKTLTGEFSGCYDVMIKNDIKWANLGLTDEEKKKYQPESFKSDIKNKYKLCKSIINELDRWLLIIETNEKPEVNQKILIQQSSKMYFVSVTWKTAAIKKSNSQIEQDVTTTTSNPAQEIFKQITIALEGHTKSYFNFTMGLSGIFTPENYTYSFNKKFVPNSPDTLVYWDSVYSLNRNLNPFTPKAFLGLGFYPWPVDELNYTVKFMIQMGVNIAVPPKHYMLGAGIDTKLGMNITAGVATYETQELLNGWEIGQEIKKVLVDKVGGSPPVQTKLKFGYFINLGFRPAIFGIFKDLFK